MLELAEATKASAPGTASGWITGISLLIAACATGATIYGLISRNRDARAQKVREDGIRSDQQCREDSLRREQQIREDGIRKAEQGRDHLVQVLVEIEEALDEIEHAAITTPTDRSHMNLLPSVMLLRRKLAKLPSGEAASYLVDCFNMLRTAYLLRADAPIAVFGTLYLARSIVGALQTGGPLPDRPRSFDTFLGRAHEIDVPATMSSTREFDLSQEDSGFSDIERFARPWRELGELSFGYGQASSSPSGEAPVS